MSMVKAKWTLLIQRGGTLHKTILFEETVDNVTWTPIDFTGYTARCHIRATSDETSELLLALTTENGGLTLGDDGTITFSASATTTAALEAGEYRYDLLLISPDAATKDYPLYGPAVVDFRTTL